MRLIESREIWDILNNGLTRVPPLYRFAHCQAVRSQTISSLAESVDELNLPHQGALGRITRQGSSRRHRWLRDAFALHPPT
jgi:hypothetical protein